MCRRCVNCLPVFLVLAAGCGRIEPSPKDKAPGLTPAQVAATADYVALLEKQIELVEELGATLAGVSADPASQDRAITKLAALTVKMDSTTKRVRDMQPSDPAVLEAAQGRVIDRLTVASQRKQAEVHRITTQVEGGADFFEKKLRPTLEALKTKR